MLAKAIDKAGSTDPVAVAKALEGMEMQSMQGSKLYMRPSDHQMIQDIHISVQSRDGVTVDADNSGFGLVTESTVPMAGADSSTTCQMDRPQG